MTAVALRARAGHRAVRAPLRWIVVVLARLFCRPLVVVGRAPEGPVVFAANHASHADTAVLLAALPRAVRARTSPAAAEDYFFRTPFLAALTRALTSAFPFPRHGRAGLDRARALLRDGRSVVLFPEGTRSICEEIGGFKRGIGALAVEGHRVVPVALVGTRDVLPKGARLPRRAPVVVAFGRPLSPGGDVPGATAHVEEEVRRLHEAAVSARPDARPPMYARARALARSPRALWLVFGWGVAEAVAFPIVPDVGVALLAAAAPMRAPWLVLAAVAGSAAGGVVTFALGALWPGMVHGLPLVTERMADAAAGWLGAEGASGLAHQPWSGVPYKAFASQAAGVGVPLDGFVAHTVLERGLRFLEVAAAFGFVGAIGRRAGDRLYGAFCACVLAFFVSGLVGVVRSWS